MKGMLEEDFPELERRRIEKEERDRKREEEQKARDEKERKRRAQIQKQRLQEIYHQLKWCRPYDEEIHVDLTKKYFNKMHHTRKKFLILCIFFFF